MNWLDLGIILLIIILLIIGIKKGFMTSVLSNFSMSVYFVLSFFLCKPIASLFNNWFHLGDSIFNSYYIKYASSYSNFTTNLLSIESSSLKSFVSSTLKEGPMSGIERGMFNLFMNNSSLSTKLESSGHSSRTLADIIGQTYSTFFTTIIGFVTAFILLFIIVLIFKLIVQKARSVQFVRVTDSILGAFYGLFRCLLIFIGICFFIKILSPISFMSSVTNYISESLFGKIIYNQISAFLDNYLSFTDIINAIFK